LRGGYPVMVGVRGIVANVLLMAALKLGDPIAVGIHVKTDDFALCAGRYRAHLLHISILRFLRCLDVNFWCQFLVKGAARHRAGAKCYTPLA